MKEKDAADSTSRSVRSVDKQEKSTMSPLLLTTRVMRPFNIDLCMQCTPINLNLKPIKAHERPSTKLTANKGIGQNSQNPELKINFEEMQTGPCLRFHQLRV